MHLSFNNESKVSFAPNVKKMKDKDDGVVVYYSSECLYIINCIKEISEYCKTQSISFVEHPITTHQEALALHSPFNNWAIFINHEYAGNVLLNKNSIQKKLFK